MRSRMNKLTLISIFVGSYMFASMHGEAENSLSQSNTDKYCFVADSSEDNFKAEARKRGGKNRGRRRGGRGLR